MQVQPRARFEAKIVWKFLSDIDDGFDAELWGKQDRPEGKELRAQVAQLRRGGDYDALAALEAQLRERIAFLRNLTPTASFTGLWKNHDFGNFGRGRRQRPLPHGLRQQQFRLGEISVPLHRRLRRGTSGAADKGLAAPAAHNTDVDENTASTLLMTRNDATLTLSENFRTMPATRRCRASPHGGDFREPFFHTGLRADDARRLKPDE